MPAIARVTDAVLSPTGTGYQCGQPMQTAIGEGNDKNVKCGGLAVAVMGNKVAPHPLAGCGPDEQTVSSYSSTIKIGGKGVARVGDMLGDNIIVQGASTTFGGG